MGFDIVSLKHELGEKCLASTKDMLKEKEGAEFDKCYMGQQLMAHMQMLDTLKVFKRHADGQFADLIQNGIGTTEDHLRHAKKLVKQHAAGAAASTARRPGTQRD
jgi:predicted outer membrane protein